MRIHTSFSYIRSHSVTVSVAALVALTVAAMVLFGGSAAQRERPMVAVTTAHAEHADISGERVFTGVLEADSATDLAAKASGRVTGLYADVGTRVGAGQVLVVLDATTERATAESLRASTDAAQKSLDALSNLYDERIASEEAPSTAGSGTVTGSYTSLTNAAALADQVSDTLGNLLSVRDGKVIGSQIGFEPEFGARDGSQKIAARNELAAYQTLNAQYQAFFDAHILGKNPDNATVAEGITRATEVLTAAKSVLNSSYTTLLNTTVSVNVSDAQISAYKQTVTSLGLQAETTLKGMHDVTTGVSVLKKERDTKIAETHAQITALKGQQAVANTMVANSTVYAPFSGVITAKYTERGAVVAPGIPVLAIADDSKLKLRIGVPDAIAQSFHVGDVSQVTIDGMEKKVAARVSKIEPVVDPASRKVTIELTINNTDHALKVGSFARASFTLEHAEGTTVPAGAVVARYGTEYVFVVRDGKVERRVVMTGNRTDDVIEIIDGIAVGDVVVTSGNAYLRDKDSVIVK